MKKIFIFVFIVFCIFKINALEYSFTDLSDFFLDKIETAYYVKDKTNIYDKNFNVIGTIKKAEVFKSNGFAEILIYDNGEYFGKQNLVKYNNGWLLDSDIILNDSDTHFTSYFTEKYIWTSIYSNIIVNSINPIDAIQELSRFCRDFPIGIEDFFVTLPLFEFGNSFLNFNINNIEYYLKILEVKNVNGTYIVNCSPCKRFLQINLKDENIPNLTISKEDTIITIKIKIDNNHLFVSNKDDLLIQEFMQVSPDWLCMFSDYINTGVKTDSLEAIGDNEFIVSINIISPQSAISENKNMLVSENLKLRSGEATTSEVITVMSAGTKVKILELGKAENIDGINSNWVKVEVLSGAKDRDGKLIKTETIGWCYGGYLK